MKVKRYFLPGLISGLLIGWALGYLRLPYVEYNQSFFVGLLAGFALISVVLLLRDRKSSGIMRALIFGCIVLGGVFAAMMLNKKNETLNLQTQQQQQKLNELSALIDSAQQRNKTVIVRDLLHSVATEMKIRRNRTLSDSTIARIAAMSFYCRPYKFIEKDSLSEKPLSPERGQLLTMLYMFGIDSACFAKIKLSSTFAFADLRGTKFQRADLSNIDLKGADFKDADLTGVNLSNADLRNASFTGANLSNANLHCTDMRRANLAWTKMNGTDITLATLNGVDLTNAQLRNADLSGTTLRWAQATGTLFNGANMTEMNLFGSRFFQANLSNTNFSRTDLRKADFTKAYLTGTELTATMVDEKWTELLQGWQLTGKNEILAAYKVVADSTDKKKNPIYRLIKIQKAQPDTLKGPH